ncbi:hypothetical protein BHE74_00056823 [Ensete ventricosum]|nr:hypothetical protein BHE74_00056823 [Ensete ventricosum]
MLLRQRSNNATTTPLPAANPTRSIKVGHSWPPSHRDRITQQQRLYPPLTEPLLRRSLSLPTMAAVPDYTAGNETPADAEPMAEAPFSPTAEVETEQNDADADAGAEEAAEAAAEEMAAQDEAPLEAAASVQGGGGPEVKKWPGWPGDNVFRLIVPVLKVGSIIGRKGELIKKLCEETKARVRILEGPIGVNDRIVSSCSPFNLGFL